MQRAGETVAGHAADRVLPPERNEESHRAGDDRPGGEDGREDARTLDLEAVSRCGSGRTRLRPPVLHRVTGHLITREEGGVKCRPRIPVLAKTYTGSIQGVEGLLVRVEVDLTQGITSYRTVGLPDASVREAEVRVRTALTNSGFGFPQCRVTVNLAPADVRKQGTAYDLAVALGDRRRHAGSTGGAPRDHSLSRRARARREPPAGSRRPSHRRRGLAERSRPGGRARGERIRGRAGQGDFGVFRAVSSGGDGFNRFRGEGATSRHATERLRCREPPRSLGRQGAAPGQAGSRDLGRGRAQPAPRRAARRGKEPSRHEASFTFPRARFRRGARNHEGLFGRRTSRRELVPVPPSVPCASPHDLCGGHGGRRREKPSGRGEPRASRGSVPGRTAGISQARARGAPPADGGRAGADSTGRQHHVSSRALYAGRGDERLSLRISRRGSASLRLHSGSDTPLPGKALRPASGPHRSQGRRASPPPRRDAGSSFGRRLGSGAAADRDGEEDSSRSDSAARRESSIPR